MRGRDLTPSGVQTYSKAKYPANAPEYVCGASGVRTWDHHYNLIDCTSALGAIILGHQDRDVNRAAREQMLRGQSFSVASDVEYKLAGRMVDLIPGMEMVRFGKNGADVTGAAVRLARAVTGREYIVYNGYHGHHDWSMTYPPKDGGVPRVMEMLNHKLPKQDLETVDEYLHGWSPAALVMEPVVSADPQVHPPGYWKEIRSLCDKYGTLLVLDEMVTFGRIGFPGAVSEWDIECDLWVGAKAMGNGWPITAILGRRDIMRRIEEDVFYSTTFAGEAVSMAAALACLDKLERKGPPKSVGKQWADAVELSCEKYGSAMRVISYDARPVLQNMADGFLEAMIEEGVLCQGYLNATWAHEDVMDELIAATDRAIERVKTGEG